MFALEPSGMVCLFLLSEVHPSPITPVTPDWLIYYEQIECNGTYSNFQRAIGQCLYHFLLYGRIPIYPAVPDDYQHLQIIEKILDYFKLPIGILTVNNKGEILTKRETKGKIRWLKLYPSKEGALTAKSTFG
jgi:hypothetical protein